MLRPFRRIDAGAASRTIVESAGDVDRVDAHVSIEWRSAVRP